MHATGNVCDHPSAPSLCQVQEGFLQLLPRIRTHAEVRFRHIRCPGRRDDAIQEVIAICWRWFLRLVEQQKDVNEFVGTLADYAVRHVRSGRCLCGQEGSSDAMSPLAQRQRGFFVQSLPRHDTGSGNYPALDALHDNTVTPPPDQAAFRIDFPLWLSLLGPRNRSIAEDMARGETTMDLAHKYPISQGRISQLRREFHLDWLRFHGEAV